MSRKENRKLRTICQLVKQHQQFQLKSKRKKTCKRVRSSAIAYSSTTAPWHSIDVDCNIEKTRDLCPK
jgi:hypothetical protein